MNLLNPSHVLSTFTDENLLSIGSSSSSLSETFNRMPLVEPFKASLNIDDFDCELELVILDRPFNSFSRSSKSPKSISGFCELLLLSDFLLSFIKSSNPPPKFTDGLLFKLITGESFKFVISMISGSIIIIIIYLLILSLPR